MKVEMTSPEQSQEQTNGGGGGGATSTPTEPPRQSNASVTSEDNLVCQWDQCGERCTSAETLYVSL